MTSPLERAAWAIHDILEGEHHKDNYVRAARAVLTAIREPSEGMQAAGYGECHHPKDIPEHIWQAMIDAALSEGG